MQHFSPFLFFGVPALIDPRRVGWDGADAFKLIFFFFKGASPQPFPHPVIVFLQPVVVL